MGSLIELKEIDLIDSFNEELIDEIIGQSVDIYKVSIDDTDENFSSKLKKFNLIGVPYQILIGKRTEGDLLEFKEIGKETQHLSLNQIIDLITKQKDKI